MRRLSLVALALVAGCGQLKQTFTGRAATAAEAGSLRLTSERLAGMLSALRGPQITADAGRFLANLWVDYALFAQAAASGKLPTDSASAAEALWPEIAELRTGHWHDSIVAHRPGVTPAAADSVYQGGEIRVFQHILIGAGSGAKPAEKAAARRKAEATLARLRRGADFGRVAAEVSDDPGSKGDQGYLPPSPRGRFVPSFDSAGWKLAPGAMSGIVETPFGYHIIKRPTAAAVQQRLVTFLGQRGGARADSTYMDALARANDLKVLPGAAAEMRAATLDPARARNSSTPLAAFKGGSLTVGEYLHWVRALPPQFSLQLKQANDTMLSRFARVLSLNLLLLRQADSAGIRLTRDEWSDLYGRYTASLDSLKTEMAIAPGAGPDSVGRQVDRYFDRLISGQVQLRPLPPALGSLLRDRSRFRVVDAGVTRAVSLAQARRTREDTAGRAGAGAGAAAGPGAGPERGPLRPAPGPPPVPR